MSAVILDMVVYKQRKAWEKQVEQERHLFCRVFEETVREVEEEQLEAAWRAMKQSIEDDVENEWTS